MNDLRALLTRREQNRMLALIFVLIFRSILEVIGVISILPFMALVSEPSLIDSNQWLAAAYRYFGFQSHQSMLITTGIASLLFLSASNGFTVFSGWIQSKFVTRVVHRLSTRIVRSYVTEPYEFFLRRNTSDLLSRVIQEATISMKEVLGAILDLVSRGFVCLIIFVMLLLINVILALIMIGVLGGVYLLIYLMKRSILDTLGAERIASNRDRFRSLTNLLSGIKEVQLHGVQQGFLDRFETASRFLADIAPRLHLMASVPRYVVETTAFGGILLVTIYLLAFSGGIQGALPILTLYALSAYRLLPSLQRVFLAATSLKHSWPAVKDLRRDYNRPIISISKIDLEPLERLSLTREMTVDNISFTYEGESAPTLSNISLRIDHGSHVAFVGRTGSGKTTLVDILTGLLHPETGVVSIDHERLTQENAARWQRSIGYVTQELFLLDDTVTRNIAFGLPDDSVDMDRVMSSAHIARAHEFVTTLLPDGYDTVIGDRGVRLSGGQRVRLGIARALYRDPSLIILDESTGALDGITEKEIVDELVNLSDDLTLILIAHRLSSVKSCDRIYFLEDGQITDSGTYEELLASNVTFGELTRLTT